MRLLIIIFGIIFFCGCISPSEYNQMNQFCSSINGSPSKTLYETITKERFITCIINGEVNEIILANGQPMINPNPYLERFNEPVIDSNYSSSGFVFH